MDKFLKFIYKALGYMKKEISSKKFQKSMQKSIKKGLQKAIKIQRK